jgi:hypothetical protein
MRDTKRSKKMAAKIVRQSPRRSTYVEAQQERSDSMIATMPNWVKAVSAVLVAAILAVCAVLSLQARPADAAIHYNVDPQRVCNWQYPSPGEFVGASSWRAWDPYSLYCYKIGLGSGFRVLGGLNIQGYCSAKYRGSKAVVIRQGSWALDDWWCRIG